LQKLFSTQLNPNINLYVFFFHKQLETSEPVEDWQALTTSMLLVLNNLINKRLKVKVQRTQVSITQLTRF